MWQARRVPGLLVRREHARCACRTHTRRSPAHPRGTNRASVCSPEQIRTAVTALRGRRPRPLDDGARLHVLLELGGEDSNPQRQDQNLLCCRLHHPRRSRQTSGRVPPDPKPQAVSIGRSRLAGIPGSLTLTPSPLVVAPRRDTRLAHARRARAARRRARVRTRPRRNIESKSGRPRCTPSTTA